MSLNPNLALQQEPFSGVYPQTIAAAATISPVTSVFFVTGTTQIATITPPTLAPHNLVAIFTDAAPGALLTTGNIIAAVTPVTNRALLLTYEPRTGKYYPIAVSGVIAVAGATAGPFTSVSSIQTVNGLVTVLTGT